MIDRVRWRRLRAVLLTARALAVEDEERDVARTLAVEATKLAPGLVPAAELAGRLLAEAGERRKAGKIIEAAWKLNPHPDLAEGYAHVRLADSARDRLARVQALARMAPGHTEGALAVARAALDAREFATARAALEPLASEPTQRVAMLMAELERLEGDEGRAREWMGARAQRGARSGLDRRRLRVGALAAGLAGERPARCVPVEGAGRRPRRAAADADRGAGRAPPTRRRPLRRSPSAEVPSPPLGNVTPENGGTSRRPPRRAGDPARAAGRADHPAGAGPGRPRPGAATTRNRRGRPSDPAPGNGFVRFSGDVGRSGNGPAGFGVPAFSGIAAGRQFLRFRAQPTIRCAEYKPR